MELLREIMGGLAIGIFFGSVLAILGRLLYLYIRRHF